MKTNIIESPINWYGGKGGNIQRRLLKKILNYINESNQSIFVDVFGGSGIVSINVKKDLRIYNDINSNLVNFFNVLKNKELRDQLIEKLTLTLYSYEIYKKAQENISSSKDLVEKALNFYIATMQSRNSVGAMKINQSWRCSTTKNGTRRGMAQAVSSWLKNIDENLPNSIERFRELQVTNEDVFSCIEKWDTKDTIFYLDPPYIQEIRVSKNVYNNEFTLQEHKNLVNRLLNIKGAAILSGYDSRIYDKLLENGWNKENFNISTSTSLKHINPKRNECLWFKNNS